MFTPRTAPLPADLPADAHGFSKILALHLNMGRGVHSASYRVHDAAGEPLPIVYAYQTDKKKPANAWRGFLFDDREGRMSSWKEVVAQWPDYLKTLSKENP